MTEETKLVLLRLLSDLPSDTVVWRSEQAWTVDAMRFHVESNSDLARQYFSDVLRVARDLLVREARRGRDRSCYRPVEVQIDGHEDQMWHEAVRFDPVDYGKRQIPVWVVLFDRMPGTPKERLLLPNTVIRAVREKEGASS